MKTTRLIKKSEKALRALREIKESQGTQLFYQALAESTRNKITRSIKELESFLYSVHSL